MPRIPDEFYGKKVEFSGQDEFSGKDEFAGKEDEFAGKDDEFAGKDEFPVRYRCQLMLWGTFLPVP